MTFSDHELMNRCRRGDPDAFEVLVRRWERPLTGIISRLTFSRAGRLGMADVEDLVQEVFVRVLSAVERYHSKSAFSTWIYQIALNVSRDAARKKKTQHKLLQTRIEPHRIPQAESPERMAQQKELEEEITQALEHLPEKLREPLVLKHFGELSFSEVAEITAVPLGTVKSRVREGLLQLQSFLKQRGIDQWDLES